MMLKDPPHKILIVEDDTTLRDNISDYLITEGFEIETAVDGEEALEKIKLFLPDLVLCDIALPKLNGFDLLQTIRKDEFLNEIPFIFLTAMVEMEYFKTGMKLGADDYITKPFDFEKLITTIKSRLNKQEEYKTLTEKKYKSLIENSLTGVFIYQTGKIVYTNPKFREIFSYDSDEDIEINKIIHQDYLLTINSYIIDCLKDKIQDFNIELKGTRKDKKEIYIQVYAGKSKYENKPCILGNVLDITTRKSSEERIRKSEKRYRELLGMVPAGIIELNKKGKILYSNYEFLHLTGYKLIEVLKRNILDLIPRNSVYNEIKELLENIFIKEHEPTPLYLEIITKNGTTKGIEARWNYIKDIEGNITGIISSLIDITEREKSRKGLIRSEERCRTFMGISSEFIWELDEKGKFNFVNDKVFDILNYEKDEIIGKSILDIIAPSDKKKVKKYLEEIYINKKSSIFFEATFLNRDNSEIIINNNCITIYDDDGIIRGIRGASLNITDLKIHKDKYIIYKNILETIINNVDNIIIFEEERNKSILETTKHFLGYSPDKFKNNEFFINEFIHPDDKDCFLINLNQWKQSDKVIFSQIYRCKSKDEKYHLIKDIRTKIRFDSIYTFNIIILNDISDKSQQEKYTIIEKIPYALILTDSDGKINYANEKFFKITGYTNKEVYGKNFIPILLKEEKIKLSDILNTLKKEWFWESYIYLKNNSDFEGWYEMCITNVEDNASKLTTLLITLYDVTKHKVKKEEIPNIEDRLDRYIKMVSRFISKLSHNIRSPSNTIIGYSEILKEECKDEKSYIILEKILNSASTITHTLDKSLKFIQLKTISDNLNFDEIDLLQVINKNIEEFRKKFYRKELSIDIIKKPKELYVYADKTLLNQLFFIIFENIVLKTKEGGILINIETHKTNEQNIAIIRMTISEITLYEVLKNSSLNNINVNDVYDFSAIDEITLDIKLMEIILNIHGATFNFECVNNEYTILTIVFPILK